MKATPVKQSAQAAAAGHGTAASLSSQGNLQQQMGASQTGFRVRNIGGQNKPTVMQMRQHQLQAEASGLSTPGSHAAGSLNSKGVPHELSKQSLVKKPRIQPLNGQPAQSLTAGKSPTKKPFNRLVPMPPPPGWIEKIAA